MAKGSRMVARQEKNAITQYFKPHELHVTTALAVISTPPQVTERVAKKEKTLWIPIEKILIDVQACFKDMIISLSEIHRCLRLWAKLGWVMLFEEEKVQITKEGQKWLPLVAEYSVN